jgi:hypothetical protein
MKREMNMSGATSRGLLTAALVAAMMSSQAVCATADETASVAPQQEATADTGDYHTPLAGEPLHTVFMGRTIDVPAMDRGNLSSLTLGATFYTPKQGDITGSPIGAFYLRRTWESSRTRNIISVFVNDLEYDKSFDGLELVTRFENYTIPDGQTETIKNEEVKQSSVKWGTLAAQIGPGVRVKVAPFQVDNDLRLQFLGKVGYFYAKSTKDTGDSLTLPKDTMLYGAKLRGRYDGMRRNLLELPHSGVAAGFDVDFTYRDNWDDFGSTALLTKATDTRNYAQYSGYLMGVGGIPGLSEKNRILASVHGGIMSQSQVDRYNCFRIGGGPLQGESDDLYRPNYPGTMFNNILVSKYVMTALEYRRELTFFMYLHLRETYIWAKRSTLTSESPIRFGFEGDHGFASTIGLDTGFFWNSAIYLDYSWDSGFIRDGKSGSGFILTWNKSF